MAAPRKQTRRAAGKARPPKRFQSTRWTCQHVTFGELPPIAVTPALAPQFLPRSTRYPTVGGVVFPIGEAFVPNAEHVAVNQNHVVQYSCLTAPAGARSVRSQKSSSTRPGQAAQQRTVNEAAE
jgi:hypothetical protein